MNVIQQITADPLQQQTLILPTGASLSITLYFIALQQGWFITNLTYGAFVLNGLRITNSPNMLNQFLNQIPFGLGCFSNGNREPSLIQDFASGNSTLYLLTQAECQQYAELLSGGP